MLNLIYAIEKLINKIVLLIKKNKCVHYKEILMTVHCSAKNCHARYFD